MSSYEGWPRTLLVLDPTSTGTRMETTVAAMNGVSAARSAGDLSAAARTLLARVVTAAAAEASEAMSAEVYKRSARRNPTTARPASRPAVVPLPPLACVAPTAVAHRTPPHH